MLVNAQIFNQKFDYIFEVDSFWDSSHDYTGLPSEVCYSSYARFHLKIL